jgi:hypothetical protein
MVPILQCGFVLSNLAFAILKCPPSFLCPSLSSFLLSWL